MDKKTARLRRAKRSRMKMKELGVNRLVIHRTPKHIYAQILSGENSQILASAATTDKTILEGLKYSGNIDAAKAVGSAVAERAVKAGVTNVAFDRSGFKYHGRVQALADAARENGLKF